MNQANRISVLVTLVLTTTAAFAQAPGTPVSAVPPAPVGSIARHPAWPVANPEDVKTPEAIVAAIYSVISGGKGQQRDWDRMRSLFVPDARLIPSVPASANSGPEHNDVIMLSVDGYIERSGARLTKDGFFERSIHNDTQQFGNIVQIWSTYESRHDAADEKPFARGINSFQLLKSGDRYWVVNIFWDSETPTKPIPAKYLP